jgi:pimeloyl-ACP methyl ester carboxylesterase/DNA-binding CsgD family transcriptional regulator
MDVPPVQYVRTSDGYDIAYAVSGQGRPVIWMPHLFSHIQVYWRQRTFIRDWLEGLASHFQLIQYDGRGQGMSSRSLPVDLSLQDHLQDLEAVVNRLRLEQFVLIAVGWAGHVAIHYAVENPSSVEALVLQACPVRGEGYEMTVFDELASRDWERFIRMIAALGQPADVASSINRLKQTVTQEDHLALARAWMKSDISDLLPGLEVPTLILHPRDYFSLPAEAAIELASRVGNARLVMTEGATVPGDATEGVAAISAFLADLTPHLAGSQPVQSPPQGLSNRELEVLRLLATGRSNQKIADELVISLNTVRRHVSNIFDKTGATNRTEAAAYAREHSLV